MPIQKERINHHEPTGEHCQRAQRSSVAIDGCLQHRKRSGHVSNVLGFRCQLLQVAGASQGTIQLVLDAGFQRYKGR